jgi:hypothetical protein
VAKKAGAHVVEISSKLRLLFSKAIKVGFGFFLLADPRVLSRSGAFYLCSVSSSCCLLAARTSEKHAHLPRKGRP